MQTTLRIDDRLYREAKIAAAREGVTLTRFIEDALRLRLRTPAPSPASRRLELPTYGSETSRFALSPSELKALIRTSEREHDLAVLQIKPPVRRRK